MCSNKRFEDCHPWNSFTEYKSSGSDSFQQQNAQVSIYLHSYLFYPLFWTPLSLTEMERKGKREDSLRSWSSVNVAPEVPSKMPQLPPLSLNLRSMQTHTSCSPSHWFRCHNALPALALFALLVRRCQGVKYSEIWENSRSSSHRSFTLLFLSLWFAHGDYLFS